MGNRGNPIVGRCRTLNLAPSAIRHEDSPLAGVVAVIWQVYIVHHIVLVAVDILITKAACVVDLCYGLRVKIASRFIPCVLMHEVIN